MEYDDLSPDDPRVVLDRLIAERGDDYKSVSHLVGRNQTYIQQFIKRGTPRKLDEDDRQILAQYFGVDEAVLGGGARQPLRTETHTRIPLLDVGASAGPGALSDGEREVGSIAFDPAWLRRAGLRPGDLSVVRVEGDSMMPTLHDGDDIMVDTGDVARQLRDGIYVIRVDGEIKVKRLSRSIVPGKVAVVSDNPAYPSYDDTALDSIEIIGRVVWTGRRIG